MKIAKSDSYMNNSENKSTMNLAIGSLDVLCKYVIANPSFVKISHITNLNSMIMCLDPSTYKNDIEKSKRIKFIKRGIEARIKYNLTDRQMIISHIISGLDFEINFIDLNQEITLDEANWAHKFVEQSVKYGFLYKYSDNLIDMCTSFKTTDFEHRGNIIPEFQQLINILCTEFRNAEMEDSMTDVTFSLTDGEFNNAITRVYETVTNPGRRLVCGMQALNQMIGGGFEEERVYIFLGITGIGKSLTLLNLANQIRKYNKDYQTKDPTKIPAVVYLTMENTVTETVTRLFDLTTESQYGMGNYSLDEVISKLKQEGQLVVNNNSPVDLVIKYKANRSVDTSYLYKLYDDLLNEGKEMICLIQDHLLRIRSIYNNIDQRIELGDITNEFKTFAAQKQISVITNFHLNREAMKIVENYGSSKKSSIDVTQRMDKSNTSESVRILNNTDVAIIINKEIDDEGRDYMGFKLIKMRDKTNLMYFVQPYAFAIYGNSIRLIEDINGPAMYKTSLVGDSNTIPQSNMRISSINSINSPISQIAKENRSKDTSFMDNDKYNIIEEDNDLDQIQEIEIRHPKVICPFSMLPKITYEEWYEAEQLSKSIAKDLEENITKEIIVNE